LTGATCCGGEPKRALAELNNSPMDRYYIDRNEEDSILLIDVTLQNAKGFLSGKRGLSVIFIGGWRVGQQT
jgi:hypothetical protein